MARTHRPQNLPKDATRSERRAGKRRTRKAAKAACRKAMGR